VETEIAAPARRKARFASEVRVRTLEPFVTTRAMSMSSSVLSKIVELSAAAVGL
jgi:hypothetical protein